MGCHPTTQPTAKTIMVGRSVAGRFPRPPRGEERLVRGARELRALPRREAQRDGREAVGVRTRSAGTPKPG